MSKKLTCIVCPIGCELMIDEANHVSGNQCKRGPEFAKNEMTHPTRVVTTTLKISHALHRRLPVVSSAPVPKEAVIDFIHEVQKHEVFAPVEEGQVLIKDVLGLGIDLISSRRMEVKK